MEYLSQYEYTISYINGERNTVANALSRLPDSTDEQTVMSMASIFTIDSDPKVVRWIKRGYRHDTWCTKLLEDLQRGVVDKKLRITLRDGLLFIGS
jgi:hypothetical protein